MKKLLICMILLNTGCVLASPPRAKFTVHVADIETGISITNAIIKTGFTLKYDPWAGGSVHDPREESVNSDGYVSFSGKTVRSSRGGSVFSNGYYPQIFSIKCKKNLVLNRWEPWNPTIEVKLRPKKNPVPMVQKYVEWKKIPLLGKPVGFDLEEADWVSPYGRGKVSDFIFTASGYFQDPKKGSEGRYILSFSNDMDGIQAYHFPIDLRSSFKWSYEAPLNGYQSSMKKQVYWPPNGGVQQTDYDDKNNYIFRTRSRQLEDGRVVGCYGVIQGELQVGPHGKIKFSYHFNPIPNERSLEYSGENLLKK